MTVMVMVMVLLPLIQQVSSCLRFFDILANDAMDGWMDWWRSLLWFEFRTWCMYHTIQSAGLPVFNVSFLFTVEASTLNERCYRLLPQDEFLRDNITRDDILIVSIGGNDVALLPTPCTIASMAGMLCLPVQCIEHGVSCCTVPMNDCCCGCGASLCSCAGSCPPCLGYFRHLFGTRWVLLHTVLTLWYYSHRWIPVGHCIVQEWWWWLTHSSQRLCVLFFKKKRVQKYIESITSKTKPKKILVCMIYYLDEAQTPSWAGASLGAMGYNRNPAKLQAFIKKAFEEATRWVLSKAV